MKGVKRGVIFNGIIVGLLIKVLSFSVFYLVFNLDQVF